MRFARSLSKVARQHLGLELLEGLLAAQGVIGRREGPARHRRDHVHLVEEAAFHAVHHHLGAAQLLQDAVAQRRGTRAAAGDGEDHQQVVGLAGAGHLGESVAGRAGLLQPRRGGPVGAAAGNTQSAANRAEAHTKAKPELSFIVSPFMVKEVSHAMKLYHKINTSKSN